MEGSANKGRPRSPGGFPERLQTAIGERSVRSFAKEAGLSDTVVRQYLSGESEPTRQTIIALARASKVAVAWLVTGEGPMREGDLSSLSLTGPDFFPVPFFPDVPVGAGPEMQIGPAEGQQVTQLAFRLDWLKGSLHLDPTRVWLLPVRGDSMEPTLKDGDIVLVDRNDQRMDRDGVYVLRMGEGYVIKRCQPFTVRRDPKEPRDPTAQDREFKVRILSDNASYPAFETSLTFPDWEVIGRAVWCFSGRKL